MDHHLGYDKGEVPPEDLGAGETAARTLDARARSTEGLAPSTGTELRRIITSMRTTLPISFDRERLEQVCRRYGIRSLAFFGSVLRADFSATSDVDVLVEFEPGRTPGLAFFSLQTELEDLLRRKVDLHTPASLSHYFREDVLKEAEPLYVAA